MIKGQKMAENDLEHLRFSILSLSGAKGGGKLFRDRGTVGNDGAVGQKTFWSKTALLGPPIPYQKDINTFCCFAAALLYPTPLKQQSEVN